MLLGTLILSDKRVPGAPGLASETWDSAILVSQSGEIAVSVLYSFHAGRNHNGQSA